MQCIGPEIGEYVVWVPTKFGFGNKGQFQPASLTGLFLARQYGGRTLRIHTNRWNGTMSRGVKELLAGGAVSPPRPPPSSAYPSLLLFFPVSSQELSSIGVQAQTLGWADGMANNAGWFVAAIMLAMEERKQQHVPWPSPNRPLP
jgi:hypothetical protein